MFIIVIKLLLVAGTLSTALGKCDDIRMPEDCVLFYTAQVIVALSYLHRLGLIYRDLKPSNVLLFKDGYIKLADLGGVADVGGRVLGAQPRRHENALFSSASSADEKRDSRENSVRQERVFSPAVPLQNATSVMGTEGYMAPEVIVAHVSSPLIVAV
jgi:serine/threonine protein kinase